MTACLPVERLFVEEIMAQVDGFNYKQAAEAALGPGHSDGYYRLAGHRLMRRPRVAAALREEARARMEAAPVLAINSVIGVLKDKTHKDHLKAALAIMNRVGMHEVQETLVRHKHELSYKDLVGELKEISGRTDIPLPKWMENAVDAEFESVPIGQAALGKPDEDRTGLEDLL